MSEENPCCVCGEWFDINALFVIDESLLHKNIVRGCISGTLKEKFICRGCQSRCDKCKGRIIYQQKRQHHGLCLPCSGTKNPAKSRP